MNGPSTEIINEIRTLRANLRRWQHSYYIEGTPEVSDLEFDRHFDRLLQLEEQYPSLKTEDSPTMRVGSDLSSDLPEVPHGIPVLSLDKAYSLEEVHSWIEKTIRNAGMDLSFGVEEKIDGVSVVLYYEEGVLKRGVTRGNGYVGNDVTANIRTIGSVPLSLSLPMTIAVRGEIFLPKGKFEELNRALDSLYANPRNLAAGTLRRVKSRDVAKVPLDIFSYEGFLDAGRGENLRALSGRGMPESQREMMDLLRDLGFKTNPRTLFFDNVSIQDLESYIRTSTEERAGLGYEIDGLVLKVNELKPREALGYTGHHPRWALAYKFESPEAASTVEQIDVQVGRTGRITPVARIRPVRVGGSTVSNVTLHNQDYVDILELAVGDKVAVSKRGDVIPAVERVLEKNEEGAPVWRMPGVCPACGTALRLVGAHHFCPNRLCPEQVKGRIRFFAAKDQMDIDSLGPETIDVLIGKGLVSSVADIYSFDAEVLGSEPGFGQKKIALMKKGIEESAGRPYERVLPSLGIPDLGQKMTELLIDAGIDNVDQLLDIASRHDTGALTAIHGIGEKTAESVIAELNTPEVRTLIRRLKEAGLSFSARPRQEEGIPQIFKGTVWCVTGSFQSFNPRSKAMDEVKKRGGKAVSAVSGNTTHLLAGEGAGTKLSRAQQLGIPVITEEKFKDILAQGAWS
ncbi:MAG: NAD-dependent DNA ligase LigA [Spirochaetales bacterium]|nr:NAD-dependent DNA ligase LigA [Spirochaetales bacterium]